jgi:predicted RNA methylase
MKLKELQGLLQDVQDFVKPKQHLEQYITGSHLAAAILLSVLARERSFVLSIQFNAGSLSL